MLAVAAAYLTYNQHIRIIKMTRTGMWLFCLLVEAYIAHAFPGVGNITGCPPTVTANFACPVPAITHTILAKAEHNVAVHFVKRRTHYLVRLFIIVERWLFRCDLAVRAPVVF